MDTLVFINCTLQIRNLRLYHIRHFFSWTEPYDVTCWKRSEIYSIKNTILLLLLIYILYLLYWINLTTFATSDIRAKVSFERKWRICYSPKFRSWQVQIKETRVFKWRCYSILLIIEILSQAGITSPRMQLLKQLYRMSRRQR